MVEREHMQAFRHAAMLPAPVHRAPILGADREAIYRQAVQGVSNRS